MAMNKMNILLNKIERRLGTKPLMLPEDISKDPIISITTNLVTKLGEVIITSDDQLYQRKED